MTAAPDERSGGSGVVLKGLAGAVLAAVMLYWLVSVRSAPVRVVAVRQCENAYHAARTAADSAAADVLRPVGPAADSGASRCQDLKRQGRLH